MKKLGYFLSWLLVLCGTTYAQTTTVTATVPQLAGGTVLARNQAAEDLSVRLINAAGNFTFNLRANTTYRFVAYPGSPSPNTITLTVPIQASGTQDISALFTPALLAPLPPAPAGAAGTAGAQGLPGIQGLQGVQGIPGTPGTPGQAGPPGPAPACTGVVVSNGTVAGCAGKLTDSAYTPSLAGANFVFVGDSLTAGLHSSTGPVTSPYSIPATPTGTDYPSVAMSLPNLIGHGAGTNVGVVGWTVGQMSSDYTAHVHPLSPAVTGKPGYLFVLGGINDLIAGTAAATVESSLSSYWASARADGWKLTVVTIPPASFTPALDSSRRAVNDYIRANGKNWTYLVDADQLLPDPTDLSFFFSDKLHPVDAGYQLLARAANAVVGTSEGTLTSVPQITPGTGVGNFRSDWSSLSAMTTGANNVALGLFNGTALTTGQNNYLTGVYAGTSIVGGNYNFCDGSGACGGIANGAGNTAVGISAAFGGDFYNTVQIGTGTNAKAGTWQVNGWNFGALTGDLTVHSAQLLPSGTQPACSAGTEGMLWYTKGSGSANGALQICQDQSGTYSWVNH